MRRRRSIEASRSVRGFSSAHHLPPHFRGWTTTLRVSCFDLSLIWPVSGTDLVQTRTLLQLTADEQTLPHRWWSVIVGHRSSVIGHFFFSSPPKPQASPQKPKIIAFISLTFILKVPLTTYLQPQRKHCLCENIVIRKFVVDLVSYAARRRTPS